MMRSVVAIALGFSALVMTAAAEQERRIEIRRVGGPSVEGVDANNDGWLTRAEAEAHAARTFAELDSNDDNRLDGADRPHAGETVDVLVDAPPAPGARVERHVTVIHRSDSSSEDVGLAPPAPPSPPIPPRPPMFVMMLASSEEADRNGDGALSRDEFVTQQMRFFDAGDGNGDGRIRFEPPPEPPQPPQPPAPPAPPR